MNDKDIINLLKKDTSEPKAKNNEWQNILQKIDTPKKSRKIFILSASGVFVSFILVLALTFNFYKNNESINETALVEYLLEDSYFYEEEELYTFLDFDLYY